MPTLRMMTFVFFGTMTALLVSSCELSGQDWLSGASAKNAEALYESGCSDLQSGARQVAIDKFSKAIELNPSFGAAYEARAATRFQMKDYADAIKDCDEVIGLNHDDERAYLIKGISRFYLKDIPGACKTLGTAITMNPDDPIARDCRGVALAELREWDNSDADFTKAIQLNSGDAKAYYGRAADECFLKEYEKSLADASDAIELLDDTISPGAYGLRAEVKCHLKDRAGAFADANSKIEANPSIDEGYLTRATVEILWDDFSDATKDLQTAFQMNPTNSLIYLYRGVMEQKLGKFDFALTDYKRGIVYDTEAFHAADIDEAMGYAQAEMGQWQPALETFRKAMAFNSPPDEVRFEVFLIECRLGQMPQAKKELATYIQTIPVAKAHDWPTSVAHFLAGTLDQTNFLAQATTTAKRPTDISEQTGDAYYYAGMEHLLAGDKTSASECFNKSLKVGDDNSYNYMMTRSLLGLSAIPGS